MPADDAVMETQTEVNDSVPVIIPPTTKPKRQLTEAQRLAFIKGREKRLANIALRKEQKAAAAAAAKAAEDAPVAMPKAPALEKVEEESLPAPAVDQHEQLAKAVATAVAEQLKPKRKPRAKKPPAPQAPTAVEPPAVAPPVPQFAYPTRPELESLGIPQNTLNFV